MKLLILTQKVDKDDPILGFFHNWILKMSEKLETVTVICLERRKSELPSNVKVFSLGKEKGESRIKYILNFYKYIWQERKNYDAAFVHMNQEYVLLGWKVWKILGKKIFLWRNHPKGGFLTSMAIWLSERVFYTSPESYSAKFKKSIQMPIGVDVEKFKDLKIERLKNSILSLGRISPIKNINLMIETIRFLDMGGVRFDIFGDPVNKEDFEYKERLIKENQDLIENKIVNFYGSLPNSVTPEKYSQYDIFLNLTPPGSADKTILEAAACGCVPFNYSIGSIKDNIAGVEVLDLDPQKNAYRIRGWFELTSEERKDEIRRSLRNYVVENHSLDILIKEICTEIKK